MLVEDELTLRRRTLVFFHSLKLVDYRLVNLTIFQYVLVLLFQTFRDIGLNLIDTHPDANLSWFSTSLFVWFPISIGFRFCFSGQAHWLSRKVLLNNPKCLFPKTSSKTWSSTRFFTFYQIQNNWTKIFKYFYLYHLSKFSAKRLGTLVRYLQVGTRNEQTFNSLLCFALWKTWSNSKRKSYISQTYHRIYLNSKSSMKLSCNKSFPGKMRSQNGVRSKWPFACSRRANIEKTNKSFIFTLYNCFIIFPWVWKKFIRFWFCFETRFLT